MAETETKKKRQTKTNEKKLKELEDNIAKAQRVVETKQNQIKRWRTECKELQGKIDLKFVKDLREKYNFDFADIEELIKNNFADNDAETETDADVDTDTDISSETESSEEVELNQEQPSETETEVFQEQTTYQIILKQAIFKEQVFIPALFLYK